MNAIRNYQTELDNLLNTLRDRDPVPRLLLHSCCAPCSTYVLSYLMEFFDITVFYYNPNIFPEEEFNKRLSVQEKLIDELNRDRTVRYQLSDREFLKNSPRAIRLITPEYDHREFLSASKGLEAEREGGKRCTVCFNLRLRKTYEAAKEGGFDYFGTTLSVSPHKNAVLLNEIGSSFPEPPMFLISDFKKKEGYKISILLSKQYDLYRQNYCGCEFSMESG